ncbi:MAG TPA: hypothetical protein VII22_28805 [Streptosporangiaceae bacterium]
MRAAGCGGRAGGCGVQAAGCGGCAGGRGQQGKAGVLITTPAAAEGNPP